MAFNAGAIKGTAFIDNKNWDLSIKGMAKGLGILGASLTALAVGGMVKATKSANEWQKSLANVTTLTDDATVSNVDMAKSLLNLDPKLGKTKGLTDAMYQSFSSGADSLQEALTVTEDSAKFAKAAVTNTSTAVDVLTTATNAYGKEQMSTSHASDIFFTTIKQGKLNGEQLASTVGKSIPLFASMNIPLEELGAGMAAMTKQGVNAAESTTQLNGIVNSFLKPSEDMKKALEEQGYASGSALLETEGLSGALAFLEKASGGSKEELSKMLPSVEAVRGALALTGTGGKEFNSILQEMEHSAGATTDAFGEQEMTWDALFSSLDKIKLVAGNIGGFFADDIAVGATTAAKGVLAFLTSSSGMELFAQLIGSVSGGFSVMKTYLDLIVETLGGIFTATVGRVKELFAELQPVFGRVQELLAELQIESGEGSIAFDLLGAASARVTAFLRIMGTGIEGTIDNLITLVSAIKETGGTIGTFFDFLKGDATWQDVKDQASSAGDAFKELGTGIVDNWEALGATVFEEITSFKENATAAATDIEQSFTLSFQTTSDNVRNNWDEMITGQEKFVGETLKNNDELVEGITEGNDEVIEATKTTVQTIKDLWNDSFIDITIGIKDIYASLVSVIEFSLGAVGDVSSLFYQNELDKIELQSQEETETLQGKLDNGIITQEEFEQAKNDIDKKALADRNDIAEKQFKTQKGLDIANVWMDAASSIAGWWAAAPLLGPIAGPIFAGVMTGASITMAGVQTAAIAGQQFIPERQFGGGASGFTKINESGSEMVMLPDGSTVIPNDITRSIAANVTGSQGNVINFYDTVIKDDVDLDRMVDYVSREIARKTRVA